MDCNHVNYSILIFEKSVKNFVAIFPEFSNIIQESGHTIIECEENAKACLGQLLYSCIQNNQLLPNPAEGETLRVRKSLPLDKLVKTSYVSLTIDYETMTSLTNPSQSSLNYQFVIDRASMCAYIEFAFKSILEDVESVFASDDELKLLFKQKLAMTQSSFLVLARRLEDNFLAQYTSFKELDTLLKKSITSLVKFIRNEMIVRHQHCLCPRIELWFNPPIRNKKESKCFYIFPDRTLAAWIVNNSNVPFDLCSVLKRTAVLMNAPFDESINIFNYTGEKIDKN